MRRGFVAALLIPLALTGATLVSVTRNRADARGPITLTDRELSASRRSDDNTVTEVYLSWHSPPWPRLDRQHFRALPRRGYVAMELGGPAFDALDLPRDVDRPRLSRLVVVDADLDARVLERRYPNPRTHLIAAATLRPLPGRPLGESLVESVEPTRIAVPREWASRLRAPYEVDVHYGARFEPWITRIGVP
jgi:hypothetical protein